MVDAGNLRNEGCLDAMARADDESLTVVDVAERLGVAPATVSNWIDSGRLKATRDDTEHVRIAQTDLDAFMGLRRVPPGYGPSWLSEHQANEEISNHQGIADALDQIAAGVISLAAAMRGSASEELQAR